MSLFFLNSTGAETSLQTMSLEEVHQKATQRLYPGGIDEEDLSVLPSLPEAIIKVNTRGLQREVLGQLYQPDRADEAEDVSEEE